MYETCDKYAIFKEKNKYLLKKIKKMQNSIDKR